MLARRTCDRRIQRRLRTKTGTQADQALRGAAAVVLLKPLNAPMFVPPNWFSFLRYFEKLPPNFIVWFPNIHVALPAYSCLSEKLS